MRSTVADAPREVSLPRPDSLLERSRAVFSRLRSLWRTNVARVLKDRRPDLSAALDVDELARRLDIERRALADASVAGGRDAVNAAQATQSEIVLYFRELHRRASHQVAATAKAVRATGIAIDLEGASATLRDLPSRTENELRRMMAEHQAALELLRDREVLQQEGYESFRKANQLHRLAEYPRTRLLNPTLVVVLAVLAALGVNQLAPQAFGGAALLSVGAMPLMALLLSCAVVAYLLGNGLREVNHVEALRRLGGWMSGGIALAFVAATAALVAHHAASTGAALTASVQGAVELLLAEPGAFLVGLAGTWEVASVVVLMGVLAIFTGYKADDSYPDYGAAQRALYDARKSLDALNKRLLARTNAIIDAADAEADQITKRIKKQFKRYVSLSGELKRLPASLEAYEAALEQTCRALLKRYRRANPNLSRDTDGTPDAKAQLPSFTVTGSAQTDIFDGDVLPEEDARMAYLQQGLRELETEAATIRQRIRDLNWLAIRELTGEEQAA